jgi:hypothetical protein
MIFASGRFGVVLVLVDVESVAVTESEGIEGLLPAVDPADQVLTPVGLGSDHEVEDLEGGLLGREVSAAAGGLAEPRVQ